MTSEPFLPNPDADLQAAIALHQSGQLREAAIRYRKLLDRFPGNPVVLNNLGAVALQLGDHAQSISLLKRTLEISPAQPLAFFNLGIGLQALGQLPEALKNYERAIALQDDHAGARFRRGLVLQELRRFDQALENYDHLLVMRPNHAGAHYQRGRVLETLNRFDEGLAAFQRAVALRPDHVGALLALGVAFSRYGRLGDAVAAYQRVIALQPDHTAAYIYRGVVLQDLKRFDEALASFDRAIALDPACAEAYWSKSCLKLLTDDYEQGWQLHEWRLKTRSLERFRREFSQPLWLGEQAVEDKTLLIHAEGGLGDVIQKCRYASMAEAMGATVVLEVPPPLMTVIASMAGNFTLLARGSPLPDFDLHCPTISLPLAFRTTVSSIPASVPYLHADAEKIALWRQRLGNKTRPRIGLVWSGMIRRDIDSNPARKRDLPLELLAPWLQLPLEFHSLQKMLRPGDEDILAGLGRIRTHHQELNDFSDTAALVEAMDLVISIDTSVPHLAGAMGKPVWVMLPFSTDYRWTADGATTPWYPTATLFRQAAIGDWSGVVVAITDQLSSRFAND